MRLDSINQAQRNAAQRKKVVVTSYFLTLLMPMALVIIICLPFAHWLTGNLRRNERIIIFIAIVFVYLAGATLLRMIWTVWMSFYLPIEEFQVIASAATAGKRVPILTTLYQRLSGRILDWKLRREQVQSRQQK